MRKHFTSFSRQIMMLLAAVGFSRTNGSHECFHKNWKLNIAKTKISQERPSRASTVRMATDGTFTIEGVDRERKTV